MGWWNDDEEPFQAQWEKICCHLKGKRNVWLMGDFNSSADRKEEGYELVSNSGWFDTYVLAQTKDSGFTVEKAIDGWKDNKVNKMRIDYIWCNAPQEISKSQIIFNGKNYAFISDHCGVIIILKK